MADRRKGLFLTIPAAVLVLGLVAIVLHVRHGVKVCIHNSGPETLHSVIVHVTGNSYPLGDLRAGSTAPVRVIANEESHVEIEFRNDKGSSRRIVVDCYFEGGPYRGTISVDLDSERVLRVSDSVTVGF